MVQCITGNKMTGYLNYQPSSLQSTRPVRTTASTDFALNFGRVPRRLVLFGSWNSAPLSEFPYIRSLAWQKNLALMSVHQHTCCPSQADSWRKPKAPATAVQTGPMASPYGIGLTFRALIHPENFHPHSTYFPLPRQSYLTHFTFPTVHFVKPYSVSTISSSLSSVKPIPRMDKPTLNNPGVYLSGQPNLLCNIQTISLVLPSVYELRHTPQIG